MSFSIGFLPSSKTLPSDLTWQFWVLQIIKRVSQLELWKFCGKNFLGLVPIEAIWLDF
jgi:hypothetical protein